MPHRLRDGLIEYLEIMQMSGVSELGLPVRLPDCPVTSPVDRSVGDPVDGSAIRRPFSEPGAIPTMADQSEAPLAKQLSTRQKTERLKLLADEVTRCSRCRELALSRTQTVFGVGHPDSELVFLGEAPGADEDRQGEPFVGRAGKLLDDIIVKGMKLKREDLYICNILRCRPPGNRNPSPEEAGHCRPFLDATLEIIRPRFICCLGSVAARNLLQTEQTIGALRGKVLDYEASFGTIQVVCTYHPAYLLRNPAAKKQTWDDIKVLMHAMNLPIN